MLGGCIKPSGFSHKAELETAGLELGKRGKLNIFWLTGDRRSSSLYFLFHGDKNDLPHTQLIRIFDPVFVQFIQIFPAVRATQLFLGDF